MIRTLAAVVIVLALGLVACPTNCDNISGPDMDGGGGVGGGGQGDTCTATNAACEFGVDLENCQCNPPPETVADFGPDIDVESMDGFSAFAVCSQDEMTQRQVWTSMRNRGYGYGRVLSESFGWSDNPVFFRVAGKAIKFKRNNNGKLIVLDEGALKEFKTCLRIAAEEDMGMMVMAIVTSLRDGSHGGNDEKRGAWVRAIATAGTPYHNVAWEVANEAWHPKSQINRADFLNSMYRLIKTVTGGQFVSQDQNLGAKFANTARYRYDYRWNSDIANFHPWRNDDPDTGDIRDILRENGGRVLLSETTSWTANPADLETFGWLVTTDKAQIQRYMDRCRPSEGCNFVFHSIEGLFTEGRFSWAPQR